MAKAWYQVDDTEWDPDAGPTGYERATVLMGPFASHEDAQEVQDPYDDRGTIIELDRGDDPPRPLHAPSPEFDAVLAREGLARRVAELARLWSLATPDVREAVDVECGLVKYLDALCEAHAAVAALDDAELDDAEVTA